MERLQFLKNMLGLSTLAALGSLSPGSITRDIETYTYEESEETEHYSEIITFGTVHLEITNLQQSLRFWTEIAGMTVRNTTEDSAELGTTTQTLVVLHQTATTPFQEGYSGLYHFAIHLPSKAAFANVLYRIMARRYPHSPVDHTMSQSIYLNDPDGITLEFVFETPERFKQVSTEKGGLQVIDAAGVFHSASERLNVNEILKSAINKDITQLLPEGTHIGHIHFHVTNLDPTNEFYKSLGMTTFNYLPAFMYADLGAGGPYKHRVALNTWHGLNKPIAPTGSAGLRHYEIVFQSETQLQQALTKIAGTTKSEDGYHVTDPSGNNLVLTAG